MRYAWFTLALLVLMFCVAGALYAAGPKEKTIQGPATYHERECASFVFLHPSGRRCTQWIPAGYRRPEPTEVRTSAWERIRGAVTG